MEGVGVKVDPHAVDVLASPSSSGGGGGGKEWSGGGGYGGGGGSAGPTDEQKRAAANLGGITGYNQSTVANKAAQSDKVYDISDKQNLNMQAISTLQNAQKTGNDWYKQVQNLQSVTSQLADASGNAMYGSGQQDLDDMVARRFDQDAAETLNTRRQNQNQVDNDYYEAVMATNNGRNEMYMNTEHDLRELAADYSAQLNNIHPDLVEDGIIDQEGHTLTPPDWLETDYFDEHVRDAIEPVTQELYRPDLSAVTANRRNLLSRNTTSQNAKSANRSYWDRARLGYNRRSQ